MIDLSALRRDKRPAETFPQDVIELQSLLGPPQPGNKLIDTVGRCSGFCLSVSSANDVG